MFQINRKEYLNMIDALGGLQDVLETERETQQSMTDSSEANFTGAAGSSLRLGIRIFLSYGVYERAYQQSKKMKESMESLLPLVNKLLGVADTLEQHLEADAATYAVTPFMFSYGQAGNEIFMLNEGYANYLEQQCEDLVEKGKILKGQMQDAINKCSDIIDCSAEQTAINEAYQSVMRIENFKQAFQSYVIGVRDLDESLRLDFQTYTDVEVVESGKALQEVVHENSGEERNIIRIREILQKPREDWTEEERIFLDRNFSIAVDEGIMINDKENLDLVTEEDLIEWGWNPNAINESMIYELNKVLIKYDINTPERIAHFMAQCLFETGAGIYTYEKGKESYFESKSYGSKYRGVGYIHMTYKYSYQAFATYLILCDFPELREYAEHKSPFGYTAELIEQEYDKVVIAAANLEIDISFYTKIVDLGYIYVSDNFSWECAGYFWSIKEINEQIDNGEAPDKISEAVNANDIGTFPDRKKNYESIIQTFQ